MLVSYTSKTKYYQQIIKGNSMQRITCITKAVIIISLFAITQNMSPTALKLTNKTDYTIVIEELLLWGIPVFAQEKKIVLPMVLAPGESLFYDAGTGGFKSVKISVKDKAHIKKTFNLNIAGIESFHLWELFTMGSEEDDSEYLILMGTGGILK
jgi:hypothetical protein